MSDGIAASALENLTDLQTPPDEIKWREGPKGSRLAYVDARYVMRVLDTLIGPGNWRCAHTAGPGNTVFCSIGIKVDGEWVEKADGAGETDIEGEKGAISDSFKRAGVRWGIGRDLYAMPSTNAPAAPARPVESRSAPSVQRAAYVNDRADADDGDGGNCPVHDTPWSFKSGGISKNGKAYDGFWKCGGRTSDGGYCQEKPGKAWAAAHERD